MDDPDFVASLLRTGVLLPVVFVSFLAIVLGALDLIIIAGPILYT